MHGSSPEDPPVLVSWQGWGRVVAGKGDLSNTRKRQDPIPSFPAIPLFPPLTYASYNWPGSKETYRLPEGQR